MDPLAIDRFEQVNKPVVLTNQIFEFPRQTIQ